MYFIFLRFRRSFMFNSTFRNGIISSGEFRFYFEKARLLINIKRSLPFQSMMLRGE